MSPGCRATKGGAGLGGRGAGASRGVALRRHSGRAAWSSAMASVTMATSEWIQFFKEAGIPPGPAVNYAVTFVDNRIQKNMLMDLNKEIMNELGITIVGDIIAILKHAKVVYRQEMCKAATESVASSQTALQSELRRNANTAATRMIANSLRRDSPPSTPVRRPDTSASKISITVSNKMAGKSTKAAVCAPRAENPTIPMKRRRVTAEMEGKYIVHMPKGTTPRTKKILEQQQAAKGLQRTSVFDRLGAETGGDTAIGSKPTGVFSRLGDVQEDKAADSDDDSSVLQYAGVLKRPSQPKESCKVGVAIKAKATSSEPRQVAADAAATTVIRRRGSKSVAGPATPAKEGMQGLSPAPGSVAKRLGKRSLKLLEAQDSSVTSSRSRPDSSFRVTINRTLGSSKVARKPGAHLAGSSPSPCPVVAAT
uniref:AKT serine/threonine kinase 2 n=1 Tax=Pseudonaja textilis TaxID=8673 RepID=A0A670ZRM1_PSETE